MKKRLSELLLVPVLAVLPALFFSTPISASKMGETGWEWPLGSSPTIVSGGEFLGNGCGPNNTALGGYGFYFNGLFHLGADMLAAADTEVRVIGAGTVKGTSANFGDDGGAVYVEHTAGNGAKFMAVYGHLKNYKTSGAVVAGEVVGRVNTNHTHFGIHPGGYASFPGNSLGTLSCSSYWTSGDSPTSTNGFVDPISYLSSNPAGAGECSIGSVPLGIRARSDVDNNAGADLFLMKSGTSGVVGNTMLSTYQSFIPSTFNWNGTGFGWSGVTPMVGDVNGDQRADLVFLTNEGTNGTKAFVATATASGFNSPVLWWNGAGWGYTGIKPALGDVDGNGGEDLVLTTSEPSGSAGFVLLSTYGTFLAPQLWWNGTGFGWSGITPLVGNVDGQNADGKKKADYIILTNEGANGTKAFVATSNGNSFGASQQWWNGAGWGYTGMKFTLGDVDGNGGADLITVTSAPAGSVGFALRSTYGTFLGPEYWWDGTGFGWSGITPMAGDTNGDKKADFVFLTNEGANGTKAFTALSDGCSFGTSQQWWSGSSWSYSNIKAYLK